MLPITDSMIRAHVAHVAAQQRALGGRMTVVGKWQIAAHFVLTHYLGPEWVAKHVLGQISGGAEFLRAEATWPQDLQSSPDIHLHNHRVLRLADLLLNFASVDGIEGRIGRIKTEDIESTVAELECAEAIYRSGIPLKFVTESSQIGKDYDLEALLGGSVVACEVKCKVENTAVSTETVKAALKRARKQLPVDKPGLVFMTIPEEWLTDPGLSEHFDAALDEIFRNTSRISAIILRFPVWGFFGNSSICRYVGATRHNPYARHSLEQYETITTTWRPDVPWRSIPDILGTSGFGPVWSFTSDDFR